MLPTGALDPAPWRAGASSCGYAVTDFAHGDGPEDPDDQLGALEGHAWDMEAEVTCPYCGEVVTIGLDPGSGPVQTYVEDCQVCCQPWRVHVSYDDGGMAAVWVDAG
jgi:cysteine-rich CPXCG protein